MDVDLELPIIFQGSKNSLVKNIYYSKENTSVSVRYIIYDPKKKCIIRLGENYPLPSKTKFSIHAEKRAMRECIRIDKKRRFNIYIFRWQKNGDIRGISCCRECYNLAHKLNFQHRIFTFNNNKVVSALQDNPSTSLGYLIKNK